MESLFEIMGLTAPRVLPQLPPFEYAKRLYWVQYVYIGTIFSLIQPHDFEERLHLTRMGVVGEEPAEPSDVEIEGHRTMAAYPMPS
jgi:hypothetical protein